MRKNYGLTFPCLDGSEISLVISASFRLLALTYRNTLPVGTPPQVLTVWNFFLPLNACCY